MRPSDFSLDLSRRVHDVGWLYRGLSRHEKRLGRSKNECPNVEAHSRDWKLSRAIRTLGLDIVMQKSLVHRLPDDRQMDSLSECR